KVVLGQSGIANIMERHVGGESIRSVQLAPMVSRRAASKRISEHAVDHVRDRHRDDPWITTDESATRRARSRAARRATHAAAARAAAHWLLPSAMPALLVVTSVFSPKNASREKNKTQ